MFLLDFIYDCKRRQRNISEKLDTLIRLPSPPATPTNKPPTKLPTTHSKNISPEKQQIIHQHQQRFQKQQNNLTNIPSTSTNIPTTTKKSNKYSTNINKDSKKQQIFH